MSQGVVLLVDGEYRSVRHFRVLLDDDSETTKRTDVVDLKGCNIVILSAKISSSVDFNDPTKQRPTRISLIERIGLLFHPKIHWFTAQYDLIFSIKYVFFHQFLQTFQVTTYSTVSTQYYLLFLSVKEQKRLESWRCIHLRTNTGR